MAVITTTLTAATQWISVIAMILFSVFGSIIQCVYIFKLFTRRQDVFKHQYFIIRGKALFITHCSINLYWSSLHPVIVCAVYIFGPHTMFSLTTLYCYCVLLTNFLALIYCTRCWLLYFMFHYYALQFTKIWTNKLLGDHYNLSWFERHKLLGNNAFLLLVGALFMFVLCAIIVPFAYRSQLSTAWQFIAEIPVILVNILTLVIVLRLYGTPSVDNYRMRHELTTITLIVCMATTMTLPLLAVAHTWLQLCLINIFVYASCFTINVYQLSNLLQVIQRQTSDISGGPGPHNQSMNLGQKISRNISLSISRNLKNGHAARGADQPSPLEREMEQLKLVDVLYDAAGINEFARFLLGEFNINHLLFLIEVSQFRAHIVSQKKSLVANSTISKSHDQMESAEHTAVSAVTTEHTSEITKKSTLSFNDDDVEKRLKADHDRDDEDDAGLMYGDKYNLSPSIPLCAVLIDFGDNVPQQAFALRDKFMPVKSETAINIGGGLRRRLLESDMERLTVYELKHVFDDAYLSVFRLLELDSFKRFMDHAMAHKNMKRMLKKIAKRKRKLRHRAQRLRRRRERERGGGGEAEQRHTLSATTYTSPQLKPTTTPQPMVKSTSMSKDSCYLSDSYLSDGDDARTPGPTPSPPPPQTAAVYDQRQFADPFRNLGDTTNRHGRQSK